MDASDGQAQLDITGDHLLEIGQELAPAAHAHEDASISDLVDSKSKFECLHCKKSYTTKKSLRRHMSSVDNTCAKERLTQEDVTARSSRPRWACSRCGKDCATNHSVERHISKSCWRTCDECAVEGITRCDSAIKTGPCRNCEGKGQSCTKHTSAIPGTNPVPWAEAAAQPQQKSSTEDGAVSTSDQKLAKRKSTTTPTTSPERTHKNKRPAPADQQVVDHGLSRMYDPLGGQAYVPPKVKKAAVSNWLDEQSGKSAPSASTHTPVQTHSPRLDQTGSMQNHHISNRQPDRFVSPAHASGGALPSSVASLSSQHGYGSSMPYHQQRLPLPPPLRNRHAINNGPTATAGFASLPYPPSYGGLPSMTVARPMQLDQMFFQMQTLRQQNQAYELDVARHFGPRNGTLLHPPAPPFGASGPLNHSGQHFAQALGRSNMPSSQALALSNLGPGDSALTLRIHSNTHDKNGQTIFSIIRMRRNETFGPRLDAYCINRGKEYGVDWMFVYRYRTGTCENPGPDMQITLAWDMTPADVKDDTLPDVTMCNMDTIYVMKAKDRASANIKQELSESGAVQPPGSQVSHEMADITSGETNYFQNPDVSRQWYQAIQQDNARLRASQNQMKLVITQQKQELFAKDQENAALIAHIAELTKTSKKYRESVQRRHENPNAPGPGPPNAHLPLSQPPASRVVRQRPEAPVQQLPPRHSLLQQTEEQTEQIKQRSKFGPNAFIAKCEAVRAPQDQAPQQLEPLTFPSFSSEATVPDYTHQANMNSAYDAQVSSQGRFYDAADKVATVGDAKEMEE